MGVYTYRRLRVAYTWFGSRVLTPKWLDDNYNEFGSRHPKLGRAMWWVWHQARQSRIIQIRYWGRS